MKPIQLFSEFEYICLCDRALKKEEQTIFILQSLTVEQEAYLDDNLEGEVPGSMKYGTTALDVLHMGLKKVKNFKLGGKEFKFERDPDGRTLPGDVKPWKSKCLARVPIQQRREISAKIRALGGVDEEELKNS